MLCYHSARTHNHIGHKGTLNFCWLNGWVFVYELSCGFKSSCSHLNFRYRTCFEQEVSCKCVWNMIKTHSHVVQPPLFKRNQSLMDHSIEDYTANSWGFWVSCKRPIGDIKGMKPLRNILGLALKVALKKSIRKKL